MVIPSEIEYETSDKQSHHSAVTIKNWSQIQEVKSAPLVGSKSSQARIRGAKSGIEKGDITSRLALVTN